MNEQVNQEPEFTFEFEGTIYGIYNQEPHDNVADWEIRDPQGIVIFQSDTEITSNMAFEILVSVRMAENRGRKDLQRQFRDLLGVQVYELRGAPDRNARQKATGCDGECCQKPDEEQKIEWSDTAPDGFCHECRWPLGRKWFKGNTLIAEFCPATGNGKVYYINEPERPPMYLKDCTLEQAEEHIRREEGWVKPEPEYTTITGRLVDFTPEYFKLQTEDNVTVQVMMNRAMVMGAWYQVRGEVNDYPILQRWQVMKTAVSIQRVQIAGFVPFEEEAP